MAPNGDHSLKRAAKGVARPLLRQLEAIHERFDRVDGSVERLSALIDESTNHLAGYIGKIETEVHELRTQVSVDVEVIAELARVVRRVVTELERSVPEVRSATDGLRLALDDVERALAASIDAGLAARTPGALDELAT